MLKDGDTVFSTRLGSVVEGLDASKTNSAGAEILSLSVADFRLDGPAWRGIWAALGLYQPDVGTTPPNPPTRAAETSPGTDKCP